MCYEWEQEYLRQRAEEARRVLEDERKRQEQQPAKPKPERSPQQPDPVPV